MFSSVLTIKKPPLCYQLQSSSLPALYWQHKNGFLDCIIPRWRRDATYSWSSTSVDVNNFYHTPTDTCQPLVFDSSNSALSFVSVTLFDLASDSSGPQPIFVMWACCPASITTKLDSLLFSPFPSI